MCSAHVRIARGAVCFPRLRNTAVPGTRTNGGRVPKLVDEFAERSLGLLPRRCCDVLTSALPRGHRRVNATMPISSGSHAPCTSLVKFAATTVDQQQDAAANSHQPERGAHLVRA